MKTVAVGLAVLLWVGISVSRAADATWTNTAGGTFSTGGNWDTGAAPGAPDTATFDRNGTYTVNWSADATNAETDVNVTSGTISLAIGAGRTYRVTDLVRIDGPQDVAGVKVQVTSGTLAVTNGSGTAVLDIGPRRDGTLRIEGGNVTADYLSLTNLTNGAGQSRLELARNGTLTTYGSHIRVTATTPTALMVGSTVPGNMTWVVRGGSNDVELFGGTLNNNFVIGNTSTCTNNRLIVSGPGTVFYSRVNGGTGHNDGYGFVMGGPGPGTADSSHKNWLIVTNGGHFKFNSRATWRGTGNKVLVTGAGSLFEMVPGGVLYHHFGGTDNEIRIENGGRYKGSSLHVGQAAAGGTVTATGAGSLLDITGAYLYTAGNGSRVIVEKGATGSVVSVWGANNSASIRVTDPGTVWRSTGHNYLGDSGQPCFVVTNGARMVCTGGFTIPGNTPQANVVVTGNGTIWTNSSSISLGSQYYSGGPPAGKRGTMRVLKGARAWNGTTYLGESTTAPATNRVGVLDVSGTNTRWTTTGGMTLGYTSGLGAPSHGILNVGDGATVFVTGAMSIQATSRVSFVSGPTSPGRINVGGLLTIAPNAQLSVDMTGLPYAANGTKVVLIDYSSGSKSGAFASDKIAVTGLSRYTLDQVTDNRVTLTIFQQGSVVTIQ